MIAALLLLAAQAGASPVLDPTPAAAPAAEIWELDQARFATPAANAPVLAKLQAAKTMSEVVDALTGEKIRFDRAHVTMDPATTPAELRARLEALPPGAPFMITQGQQATVSVLVARQPGSAAAIAAAPVDPKLAAAAEELLREMHAEEQMQTVVRQNVAQMRSGAAINAQIERNDAMRMQRAKNPQAWADAAVRVGALQADAMEKVVAELVPELHRQSVAAYASNYTLAELRELTAFYRSPLGRKTIERAPAIGTATAVWFQRAFTARLLPAMAALQPQIQQILGPLLTPTPAR
jgi:uncharacterized protein